ncbi:unnamed protein product [Laminaria digitata]
MPVRSLCVHPSSCSWPTFARFTHVSVTFLTFEIHAFVRIDPVSIVTLLPLRSLPVNINPMSVMFLNLRAPCLRARIVVSLSVIVCRGTGAAAGGAPRPIRTQIPPPMDRRAASYVKDRLVYEEFQQQPQSSLEPQDPFQRQQPEKKRRRGVIRFLRRIILGKKD